MILTEALFGKLGQSKLLSLAHSMAKKQETNRNQTSKTELEPSHSKAQQGGCRHKKLFIYLLVTHKEHQNTFLGYISIF